MARKALLLAVVVVSFAMVGCSAELGVRDGVQDGLSAALSALIQAPVDAWLNATFPG